MRHQHGLTHTHTHTHTHSHTHTHTTHSHTHTHTQHTHTTHTLTHTHTHSHTNTVGYAPFLSMAVRESFLTVGEQLAAAPGPGHYSLNTAFRPNKGGGILHNKVAIVCSDSTHVAQRCELAYQGYNTCYFSPLCLYLFPPPYHPHPSLLPPFLVSLFSPLPLPIPG